MTSVAMKQTMDINADVSNAKTIKDFTPMGVETPLPLGEAAVR